MVDEGEMRKIVRLLKKGKPVYMAFEFPNGKVESVKEVTEFEAKYEGRRVTEVKMFLKLSGGEWISTKWVCGMWNSIVVPASFIKDGGNNYHD